MTLVTLPLTPVMEQAAIKIISLTALNTSPYNGTSQRLESSYSMWHITGNYPTMEPAEARAWRSFFAKLRGQANTFQLPIPGWPGPSTGYAGTLGTVSGAGQTGTALDTTGWDANEPILLEGDYFTVGDELKLATADATADGAGDLTIAFEPPINNSPTDASSLTIDAPYAIMALTSDEPGWAMSPPYLHDFAMSAIEVIV